MTLRDAMIQIAATRKRFTPRWVAARFGVSLERVHEEIGVLVGSGLLERLNGSHYRGVDPLSGATSRLLTQEETCKTLKCSKPVLQHWIDMGYLVTVIQGTTTMITSESVDNFQRQL